MTRTTPRGLRRGGRVDRRAAGRGRSRRRPARRGASRHLEVVGVAGPARHLGRGVVSPGFFLQLVHRHLPEGASAPIRAPSATSGRPRRKRWRSRSGLRNPG